jgi:hypothetical protein
LRIILHGAKPSLVRMRPDIGIAYREILSKLRKSLASDDNPAALDITRSLIERVTIHAAPRKAQPRITVEGHLANMLTTAQPELSLNAAIVASSVVSASLVDTQTDGADRLYLRTGDDGVSVATPSSGPRVRIP